MLRSSPLPVSPSPPSLARRLLKLPLKKLLLSKLRLKKLWLLKLPPPKPMLLPRTKWPLPLKPQPPKKLLRLLNNPSGLPALA